MWCVPQTAMRSAGISGPTGWVQRCTTRSRSPSSLRTRFATAPCPNAEAWSAGCVSVPCFPELTDAEVELVCNALRGAPA